jgi:shikimate kinase
LVGLPGAGKSSVGAELALRLDCLFADTDDVVIAMTGRSVAEIFASDGETAFREVEATAIADALLDFDGVLALGGGAVTTEAVRHALQDAGVPVLMLTAEQDELLERMDGSRHRPLLAGNAAERLSELAVARDPLYREVATLTVDTTGLSVHEVVADIERQLAGEPL